MRARSASSLRGLPARAQALAGLLGLGELDQLLEREPEQVAQAHDLAQASDVGLGVEPVAALGPVRAPAEQTELLVVADRAGGGADQARDLADAVRRPTLARARACPMRLVEARRDDRRSRPCPALASATPRSAPARDDGS